MLAGQLLVSSYFSQMGPGLCSLYNFNNGHYCIVDDFVALVKAGIWVCGLVSKLSNYETHFRCSPDGSEQVHADALGDLPLHRPGAGSTARPSGSPRTSVEMPRAWWVSKSKP